MFKVSLSPVASSTLPARLQLLALLVCSTAWTSHWLFLTSRGCSFMETRSFNALLLQNGLKESLVQCLYQGSFSSLHWGENTSWILKLQAAAIAAVVATGKCLSASGEKMMKKYKHQSNRHFWANLSLIVYVHSLLKMHVFVYLCLHFAC